MLAPADLDRVRAAYPKMNAEQRAKADALLGQFAKIKQERPWAGYRYDPVGYARDVLGIEYLTPDQEKILKAIHEPPYKLLVESAHSIGKTFLAAIIVNYFFDSFGPCWIVTTAPTDRDVRNLLWMEVRLQRTAASKRFENYPMPFIGPSAPEMRLGDNWLAQGFTAKEANSFQGRHHEYMCFVFDESEGIPEQFWTTTKTMFQPNGNHVWMSICNPTTNSSQAYMESQASDENGNPSWRHFSISALDHPNIGAELSGKEPIIPAAVTVGQIKEWLSSWCEKIKSFERTATDIEFPPGSGNWYRPGPQAESRMLGRRPSQGTWSVWSDALWKACCEMDYEKMFPLDEMPELGCDVARVMGGDDCDIHVRWGGVSLAHDSANGRSIPGTAARLKEMADEAAEFANAYRQHLIEKGAKPFRGVDIPVKVDDSGIGGAVNDLRGRYNFIPVNASTVNMELKYPNLRSELWFETMERGRLGGISLKYILEHDQKSLHKLKLQAFAPTWEQDARKRRVVECKEDTKKRLGRSPDAADAFNLAYYEPGPAVASMIGPKISTSRYDQTEGARQGTLGRIKQREDIDDEEPESMAQKAGLWGRRR